MLLRVVKYVEPEVHRLGQLLDRVQDEGGVLGEEAMEVSGEYTRYKGFILSTTYEDRINTEGKSERYWYGVMVGEIMGREISHMTGEYRDRREAEATLYKYVNAMVK